MSHRKPKIPICVGDEVRIISDCNSTGRIGTIVNIGEYCYSVKFNEFDVRTFGKNSVEKVLEKGEKEMTLDGKYRIALVRFQNNPSNKEYCFALYDDSVDIGDYVVCDSSTGWGIANVYNIVPADVAEYKPTREIICKIDVSKFEKRKSIRTKKKDIKNKLDAAVANNQNLIMYEAVAKQVPEVAELLEAYKTLLNEDV